MEYFAGKKIMIPYRVLYIIVAVIAPIAPLNLILAGSGYPECPHGDPQPGGCASSVAGDRYGDKEISEQPGYEG